MDTISPTACNCNTFDDTFRPPLGNPLKDSFEGTATGASFIHIQLCWRFR